MIYEEKIFLALRHGGVLITGWQPGEDVVLAAARSPRGRAKHVCNLAAWHDTASSECYSPETGPELLSSPVMPVGRLVFIRLPGSGRAECVTGGAHRREEGRRRSADRGEVINYPSFLLGSFIRSESQMSLGTRWGSNRLGETRGSCAGQSMRLLEHHGKWSPRVKWFAFCGAPTLICASFPIGRSHGLRPKAEMIIGICALIGVSSFFMLCSARAHVIKTNVITSIIGWQ